MNRRELIAGVSVSLVGLSGCTALLSGSESANGTRVTNVEVANRTSDPQTVHLLVFYDEELTYWGEKDAEPHDDETDRAGGGPIEQTWPDEPGVFEIYARLDEEDSWQSLTLDSDVDVSCVEVFATIDDRGLRLWRTDECPD